MALTRSYKETVVARKNLKELRASSVSLMPAGLLDKVSDTQIADLYAYLKTLGAPAVATSR